VTLADASQGGIRWPEVPGYLAGQIAGALMGVVVAHLMFREQVLQVATNVRSGGSQVLSEFVATFGLLAVIWGCSRRRADAVAGAGAATVVFRWLTPALPSRATDIVVPRRSG
jgi:glycerol uptake facilitator-like aquaporin